MGRAIGMLSTRAAATEQQSAVGKSGPRQGNVGIVVIHGRVFLSPWPTDVRLWRGMNTPIRIGLGFSQEPSLRPSAVWSTCKEKREYPRGPAPSATPRAEAWVKSSGSQI